MLWFTREKSRYGAKMLFDTGKPQAAFNFAVIFLGFVAGTALCLRVAGAAFFLLV